LPHAPQFLESSAMATSHPSPQKFELQSLWSPLQVGWHFESTQAMEVPSGMTPSPHVHEIDDDGAVSQAFPQAPQFSGSSERRTH
jgi:hypothetical protein